jgi:hypothetical protein
MMITINPIGAPIVVIFLILLAIGAGYIVFKELDRQERQARKKKKEQRSSTLHQHS